MDSTAIRCDSIAKRYRLVRRERYVALRDVLAHAIRRPWAGGADEDAETFWALRGVDLEIRHGEVVGVIGRNGAGKSTLLKILSRITDPTEGTALVRGRVGSLLEVGTGFHPELTGRENIYLNGAILGMKRAEIARKFDEIVAFAEVERFLDTPVKHYSSGMYVRLAFAVAAHLEPEILLVDEVLAVGDVAFQRKCLGKMGDIATHGRTVLFVSHNMGAVARLCSRGVLLDQGRIAATGSIADVVDTYMRMAIGGSTDVVFPIDSSRRMQFLAAALRDHTGSCASELDREMPFSVSLEYEVRQRICGAHVGLMLDRIDGTAVWHSGDIDTAPEGAVQREPGTYRAIVDFPGGLLNAGAYQIRIAIARYGGDVYDYREPFVFQLNDHGTFAASGAGGAQRAGVLALPLTWRTETVSELKASAS